METYTDTDYRVSVKCRDCGEWCTGQNRVEKFAADIALLALNVHVTTVHDTEGN